VDNKIKHACLVRASGKPFSVSDYLKSTIPDYLTPENISTYREKIKLIEREHKTDFAKCFRAYCNYFRINPDKQVLYQYAKNTEWGFVSPDIFPLVGL